jgi:NAD(P)-dependent dehydrogenase (short-subunit alcohol dehydrogenase family)
LRCPRSAFGATPRGVFGRPLLTFLAGAKRTKNRITARFRTLVALDFEHWLISGCNNSGLFYYTCAAPRRASGRGGWAFTPGFGHYNATKAALNSLAGSLAAEAAARYPAADVQINVLNPGEARTEMNGGSTTSPYAAVSMTLILLSHPPSGPNGCFFARDGRHLGFAYAKPWPRELL